MDAILKKVNMKTLILIMCTFTYCAFMTYAMYHIGTNTVEHRHISLLTHLPMLLFSIILVSFRNGSKNNYIDKQLYMVGEFTIISFLLLYCLNSFGYISNVTNKLLFFSGMNAAFIGLLIINGLKHGLFKKRK